MGKWEKGVVSGIIKKTQSGRKWVWRGSVVFIKWEKVGETKLNN